jgi:phage terminase large subunit-like protein
MVLLKEPGATSYDEASLPSGLPREVKPFRFRIPAKLADNAEFKRKLAGLKHAIWANPLLRYNNPDLPGRVHRKQLEFNAIQCPPLGTKALFAGNRSGKTVACVVDDVIQLVREEFVPDHLKAYKKFHGPIDIWIGAPKFTKHEDTIIPLLRTFLPKAELIDGSFDKSYNSHTRTITLVSGSTVALKTYDQDIDAWASAAVHRIHWDEEPNNANGRKLRDEARARLVSTNGDEIIGMTPLLGLSTWAHDDVYEKRHEPQITVMGMDIADNPWNSSEAIAAFLSGLTVEERKVRKTGAFIHFGGVFFDEFDGELHVVKPPGVKHVRELESVIAIDPGLRHTGVTWTGFDSDNAALTYDEYDAGFLIVPEIAKEIKRRNAEKWHIEDPTYVLDPSHRNLSSSINADEIEAAYAREDIYCEPGQNSRRAGILEMKRRLQAIDAAGNPHPTWLISEECAMLIVQVERYRRDPDASDEWQAVPQDDRTRFDLVDATRYGVMSRTYFDDEDEEREGLERQRHRESHRHNYEPELDLSEFQTEAPPMGDAS